MDSVRKGAYLVLRDVEENKAYSNFALMKYIKKAKPSNVPFLRELVYGTIRQKLYLDWIIGNFTRTPIEKLNISDRILLRLGLYQLLFMDSVPDYAAVSETVELAKLYSKGRINFVNGLLRQYLRDRDYVELPPREEDETRYLSIKYSFAPWVVQMWLKEFGNNGARVENLLAALNRTPRLCIRANTLKTDADGLAGRLTKLGFEAERDPELQNLIYVKGEGLLATNLYKTGLFSVQDKGAQTVVECLDARPGETVMDVCAAPGGKTVAIAADMQNLGKVLATDIYKRKIDLIEGEAARLGVKNITAWSWDARVTDSEFVDSADKVLVDAPCSGLGTARRKPEVKFKEFDEEMQALPGLQLDILKASSHYVRPGGTLVYATCTIAKRENEDVVKAFLKKNKEFELVDKALLLPMTDESDGFFVCKMKREERGFGV